MSITTPVIEQIHRHASIRKYKADPIDCSLIEAIVAAGQRAAVRGRGFGAACHFSPVEATKAIPAYKAAFQPSAYLAHPYTILCVSVICAESQAAAETLKVTADLTTLRRQKGERGAPLTPDEARAYVFSPEELEKLRPFAPIYGDPDGVRQALTELTTSLNADELMVVTNISDQAARRRSYELLAETFDLRPERWSGTAVTYHNGSKALRTPANARRAELATA